MEWWHIFGIGFIVFTLLYIGAAISRQTEIEKKQENLLIMSDLHEEGGWLAKDELTKLTRGGISEREDNFYDEDESFITKLPRAINRGINAKLTNLNLKDKVKTGELQVKHIGNALQYAKTHSKLENTQKKHEIKNLKLDRKIVENQNNLDDEKGNDESRKLKNESKRLDYELEIARKKKQLAELQNPTAAAKTITPEEKKIQDREEIESKIGKLEEKRREIDENKSISEETRKAQINQIDNKLHDLYQESLDLL